MSTATSRRREMVRQQIAGRGIADSRTLDAMSTVPREAFVPDDLAEFAYEDTPLPIEESQTISQPFVVAMMIEALDVHPTDRALEIGAGSGYAAAVFSRVAGEVYAVERFETLAILARRRMERLAYTNVHILCGDGTLGWRERAPYDVIMVSAGGPAVPQSLLDQLTVGGRLIIPVGAEPRSQQLLRIHRTGKHQYEEESLGNVWFVPLIGTEGWRMDCLPITPHRAKPSVQITPPRRPQLGRLTAENTE